MTRLGARVPAAGILLVLLAAAGTANAQTAPLPEDFSAADQYVESVPTSGGPKPAETERREKEKGEQGDLQPAPVPAAVNELDGELKEVATSLSLGAPERGLSDTREAESPSVPTATVSAVDDADGGRLVWLLVALLVISSAMAGTAVYRHRARRKPTDT